MSQYVIGFTNQGTWSGKHNRGNLFPVFAVSNRYRMGNFELNQETCPLQYSFTKADRILKRHEFIALAKSGRRIQNEYFIAVFSPGRHGWSRLGVTVTKKVGGAVKRNRIKRLVREFFRLNRQFLSGEWDINIIAKNQIADTSFEKANQSLHNIFNRISRYDDPQ
jgi:ribonuclease P protein component